MTAAPKYQILEDVSYYGNGEPFWKLDLALPIDAHQRVAASRAISAWWGL